MDNPLAAEGRAQFIAGQHTGQWQRLSAASGQRRDFAAPVLARIERDQQQRSLAAPQRLRDPVETGNSEPGPTSQPHPVTAAPRQ